MSARGCALRYLAAPAPARTVSSFEPGTEPELHRAPVEGDWLLAYSKRAPDEDLVLVIVNLVTSPDRIWFYWPLLGWGIGLLAHAASVFMYENPWGKDWEDRKIKELMDKDTSR